MNYALNFSHLAIQDLRKICKWYDDQTPGLADEFLDELQILIGKIAENPEHFAKKESDARMALLRRFPYKVFFMVNERQAKVRIIAVIHRARSPQAWKKRL
jgi:plasmid stabilization system protein ParE